MSVHWLEHQICKQKKRSIWQLLGSYEKHHFLGKNWCDYFLGNFWKKNWATFYSAIWSQWIRDFSYFLKKIGQSWPLFSLFSSFQYIWQKIFNINFCRWLDTNRVPLESEATALPTEPQPLFVLFATCYWFPIYRLCTVWNTSKQLTFVISMFP